MTSHILADTFSPLPDRRTTERRVSPAVGSFAIQECSRLRALNAELATQLQHAIDILDQSSADAPGSLRFMRVALAKAQP